MALTYDLREIQNFKNLCWTPTQVRGEYRLTPVTNAIIWGMVTVGIPEITAKNAEEVYLRFAMWGISGGGGPTHPDCLPRLLTPGDIAAHIGLVTNAQTKSKRVFKEDISRFLRERAERKLAQYTTGEE